MFPRLSVRASDEDRRTENAETDDLPDDVPDDQRAGVLRECLAARRADTRMPARSAAAKDAQATQKVNIPTL